MLRNLLVAFFLSITCVTCSSDDHYLKIPDVSKIQVDLKIARLERVLFGLTSKEEIRTFLKDYPLFAKKFLKLDTYSHDSILVDELWQLTHNAHMVTLYEEVQRVFGNFSTIQHQLEEAFRYIRYYYPSFHLPKIATFITGMGTDLYVDDSLIVIGLDFFLGEGAKFRPIALPQYICNTYQPLSIVPKIMLLISQQFNETDNEDHTLLADMIYYGKAYYFTKSVLPFTADSLIIAYTAQQLADVQQNQAIVWEHFIENELFYKTDHSVVNKYINDRPFTLEIGPRCPGRIGHWLGWEIVKKYMAMHTDLTLPTLMRNSHAQALLRQSKYRPRGL
ncbi:MAG: gliding motility lipoprotein GldB [Cytophagales bacterium]|nr:gliding motility lipoprotein GldB [Cytophagales bacterium]